MPGGKEAKTITIIIFYLLNFLSLRNMSTKIQLSQEEIELVNNTDWIVTKRIITKKVYEMFGDINERMKKEIDTSYSHLFPENIKHQSGKISQGENYQLLPYVILDYPAFFWKDRAFAIRTMFWWGNFFSVTLHLSGIYKEKLVSNSNDVLTFLQSNNFFVCVNEAEWQHNFEENNYVSSPAISLQQFASINEKAFFKVSKKISLSEWDNANEFALKSFREIMQLLQISYPAGKKDLLFEFPKAGSDL